MRWLWRDAQVIPTDRIDLVERSFRAPFGQTTNAPTSGP
jgi:hypothetical protein